MIGAASAELSRQEWMEGSVIETYTLRLTQVRAAQAMVNFATVA